MPSSAHLSIPQDGGRESENFYVHCFFWKNKREIGTIFKIQAGSKIVILITAYWIGTVVVVRLDRGARGMQHSNGNEFNLEVYILKPIIVDLFFSGNFFASSPVDLRRVLRL